jgi:hypothetical protein
MNARFERVIDRAVQRFAEILQARVQARFRIVAAIQLHAEMGVCEVHNFDWMIELGQLEFRVPSSEF